MVNTCTYLFNEVKPLVLGKSDRHQPAVRIIRTELLTPLREGEKDGVFAGLGVHDDFVGVRYLPVLPIDENMVSGD